MLASADIIIIGGGITGCALLFELSKHQLGNILLLEKNELASGTTGQSGGFIRKLSANSTVAKLMNDSFDYYQLFENEVGNRCGFVQTGMTYRVANPLPVNMKTSMTELIVKNYPVAFTESSQNATLIQEPQAGSINTKLTCQNWVKAAKKNGAVCYENTKVEKIITKKNKIYGVATSHGTILSDQVVIASGAWSNELLSSLGIEVPLDIKSFQYQIYPQAANYLKSAYLDLIDQYYIFPFQNGDVVAGFLNQDKLMTSNSFDHPVDQIAAENLHQILKNQFAWLNSYVIKASYDAFTHHDEGITDYSAQIEGLLLATGWSGGGIKIAPAVAKKLTKKILNWREYANNDY